MEGSQLFLYSSKTHLSVPQLLENGTAALGIELEGYSGSAVEELNYRTALICFNVNMHESYGTQKPTVLNVYAGKPKVTVG